MTIQPGVLCFSSDFDSGIRISKRYAAETYEVLTAKCQTSELSRRHRPRTALSCQTGFTVLYKNSKQGDCQITQVIKPIRSS